MDGLMDAYALQSPEPSSLSCMVWQTNAVQGFPFPLDFKTLFTDFGRTPYCKVSTYTGQHKQQKCRHTSTPEGGSESIILMFKWQKAVYSSGYCDQHYNFSAFRKYFMAIQTPGYLTFSSYMLFQSSSSSSVNKSIKDWVIWLVLALNWSVHHIWNAHAQFFFSISANWNS
jgi:hypothetical protein